MLGNCLHCGAVLFSKYFFMARINVPDIISAAPMALRKYGVSWKSKTWYRYARTISICRTIETGPAFSVCKKYYDTKKHV